MSILLRFLLPAALALGTAAVVSDSGAGRGDADPGKPTDAPRAALAVEATARTATILEYQACDEHGRPLEGVRATSRWAHYTEQPTDASGRGWVRLPEDPQERALRLESRGRQFVRLDLRDGAPDHPLRLVFPPPAALRPRLPEGTPPTGYRATLTLGPGVIHIPYQHPHPFAPATEAEEDTPCRLIYRPFEDRDGSEVLIEVSFNERGEALLGGFLDVDTCALELRFLETPIDRRQVALRKEGGELVVDLPAAAFARHRELRVLGPDRRPLAGARVEVEPVPRDPMGSLECYAVGLPPPMRVHTDADGRARLPLGGDDAGRVVLVHAAGHGRRVHDYAELAESGWEVTLEPAAEFRLLLTDCDGVAVSQADLTPVYGPFLNHALVHLGHGYWTEGDERIIARDVDGRRDPTIPDVWVFRDLPAAALAFTVEQVPAEHAVTIDTRVGSARWSLPLPCDRIYLPGPGDK